MILSTGTRVYANNDIIGIGPETDDIFEGFDGVVCRLVHDEDRYEAVECSLTNEEKIEIANIAIKRWESFKEKVTKLNL